MASPSTKPLTMLPPIRAPPPTGTGFAGQLPFMISKPHSSRPPPSRKGWKGKATGSSEPSKGGEEDERGREKEWIHSGWGRYPFASCASSPGKLPEEEQCLPGWASVTQPPLTGVALSVLVVLLLAVLYEGIKVGKARLLHQALTSLSISTSQQLIEDTDQNSSSSDSPQVSRTRLRWFLCHFGQSLLHVAQVVIGYFMMLAVMSYNTWIFFGVVLGSGVGYYLAYPLLSMT
uniref:Copper transport protein n=1 Tax=Phocoena sinus TaxID=42100 RepID=A0A8C9C7J8_PHOSS